jgi:hypothetical protein
VNIKPNFERSADIEKCTEFLRNKSEATYGELSTLLNRDIQGRDRYILTAARNRLEREGIVFAVMTGVGIRRATDAEVAAMSTTAAIHKIKRTVGRSRKRHKAVNTQGLTAEERDNFFVGIAVIGAVGQAARAAFRTRLTKATRESDEALSLQETLRLFRSIRPKG